MKKLFAMMLLGCGLLSAQGAIFNYDVTLSGPAEFPPVASPGFGTGTVSYDNFLHTLTLSLSFTGLLGNTTASHIHAPTTNAFAGTAGVATTTPTFAGFPLGVTSGTYSNKLDLTLASSYNPAFVTANGGTPATAEAALTAAMAANEAYWNIHTSVSPGGEIRGFLVAVPEPSSLALLSLFVFGVAARAWKKKLIRST